MFVLAEELRLFPIKKKKKKKNISTIPDTI